MKNERKPIITVTFVIVIVFQMQLTIELAELCILLLAYLILIGLCSVSVVFVL